MHVVTIVHRNTVGGTEPRHAVVTAKNAINRFASQPFINGEGTHGMGIEHRACQDRQGKGKEQNKPNKDGEKYVHKTVFFLAAKIRNIFKGTKKKE